MMHVQSCSFAHKINCLLTLSFKLPLSPRRLSRLRRQKELTEKARKDAAQKQAKEEAGTVTGKNQRFIFFVNYYTIVSRVSSHLLHRSLRKQPKFRDANGAFTAKMSPEKPAQKCHTDDVLSLPRSGFDLGSTSDWMKQIWNQSQAAQARCLNYGEFRYCFAYYERFEDFLWEIQYSCLRKTIGMNIEIYWLRT